MLLVRPSCAVILKSEKDIKDIPISWRYGVDTTRDMIPAETDEEMWQLNCGEGKTMEGGPVCIVDGKHVPKASITSELLFNMLTYLD